MRQRSLFLFLAVAAAGSAWAQAGAGSLLLVSGGTFKNPKSNYHGKNITVPDFYLGKYEVTQKEWAEVMGSNPSQFQGDNLPVETVSWYDCIEYCNQRSLKEGLKPCYVIAKDRQDPANHTLIDDVKWTVTCDAAANGYRLPTEIEWEYAAGGGQLSQGYAYSGGEEIGLVAWFWQNAGDEFLPAPWNWHKIQQNHNKPQPVGTRAPNELGFYDMSGNVREWCWDWFGDLAADGGAAAESSAEAGRVWKGGGWIGGDFCCAPSFRAGYEANGRGPDQGLRVCRSK
jgi:formylglycine-generating enzyme required for sulfatase activity